MRNSLLGLVLLAACGGGSASHSAQATAPTPATATATAAAAAAPAPAAAAPASAAAPRIERVASPAEGIFANAYLIETQAGVIAIDATLRVSDAKALRARIDAIGKPLLGVLLTHGHPDHYNGAGIVAGGAPVIATRAVDAVIREHDAAKERQWKPMFGAEWPERRAFPTRTVADGDAVELGGLSLRVHAVGAAESHADSYWTIDGVPGAIFVGDLVFPDMHAYVSDGHTRAWLDALAALERGLPTGATLYPGHGEPGGVALLAAQRRYLEAVRAEVARLSPKGAPLDDGAKAKLAAAMKRHQPSDALAFLVGLGADAVAAEVAAEVK